MKYLLDTNAVIAILNANDLILITDNVKEFLRVDGLQIENWLK